MTEKKQELSVREAAELCGVNVSYIRRLAADGRIEARLLGNRFYIIERVDLMRWQEGRKKE